MFDSVPMPGAWNSIWDSPLATTRRLSDSNEGVGAGPSPPRSPVREVPLSTDQRPSPPLRVAPLPTRQTISPRTWDKDYNPFEFQTGPAVEIPEEAPELRAPSSSCYESCADNFDSEANTELTPEDKRPIVIALFGQTGTGKTSFIKAVTGKDLKVGHSLTSCENFHLDLQ